MLTAWQPHLLLAKSPVTSNKDPTPGARWSQRIERVLRDCLVSVFKQECVNHPGPKAPFLFLDIFKDRDRGGGETPKSSGLQLCLGSIL